MLAAPSGTRQHNKSGSAFCGTRCFSRDSLAGISRLKALLRPLLRRAYANMISVPATVRITLAKA